MRTTHASPEPTDGRLWVSTSADGPLLHIQGLTKDFRGLRALDSYHLELNAGEVLGVIGPNGAGKTTLFNLITGMLRPTSGRVVWQNRDITHLNPDVIARTFQNIRLFTSMSVLDNVKSALQLHRPVDVASVLVSAPHFLRSEAKLHSDALEILEVFGLERYQASPARNLSYGDQRRLEMARALATQPQLLLLDEPTVGMNPSESRELLSLIRSLHQQYRLTIVLVAHDMQLVMGLCQRLQVLTNGMTIAEGEPSQVRSHPRVIEAYLGRVHTNAEVA
jgi:branched-chain amino acid transport system ATP-binding protein